MSAEPSASRDSLEAEARPVDAQQVLDAQHPWLGLASFTEQTRGYFHGREEEVAELGRRVQRKLLTVLFGQSGLGKLDHYARTNSCDEPLRQRLHRRWRE